MATLNQSLTWLLPWRAKQRLTELEAVADALREKCGKQDEISKLTSNALKESIAKREAAETQVKQLRDWIRITHRLDVAFDANGIKALLQRR